MSSRHEGGTFWRVYKERADKPDDFCGEFETEEEARAAADSGVTASDAPAHNAGDEQGCEGNWYTESYWIVPTDYPDPDVKAGTWYRLYKGQEDPVDYCGEFETEEEARAAADDGASGPNQAEFGTLRAMGRLYELPDPAGVERGEDGEWCSGDYCIIPTDYGEDAEDDEGEDDEGEA